MGVAVAVRVGVGVRVAVAVRVGVRVLVGVRVGVAVRVGVSVAVGVTVGVSVGVGEQIRAGHCVAEAVRVGVHVGGTVAVAVREGVGVNTTGPAVRLTSRLISRTLNPMMAPPPNTYNKIRWVLGRTGLRPLRTARGLTVTVGLRTAGAAGSIGAAG